MAAELEEAVSGVEARSVGRSVVVSPLHTAPSRALASVVPSLERTGGLCARAGGGGVRPGPEQSTLGGGREVSGPLATGLKKIRLDDFVSRQGRNCPTHASTLSLNHSQTSRIISLKQNINWGPDRGVRKPILNSDRCKSQRNWQPFIH